MTHSNHPQTTQQSPKPNSRGATEPPMVSEANPRYFTTRSGKQTNREAIYPPILMDFGIIAGVNPLAPTSGGPGIPPYETFEPARYAMGDTLRYARKMDLLAMEPRGDLSSTGYALANPNQEYIVLQPSEITDPLTVRLGVGAYIVEWSSVNRRETTEAGKVTIEIEGSTSFTAPFAEPGPTVLYLKRVGH